MSITAINAIAGICFALLTIEFVYVLLRLAFSDRKSRIAFLKNFKIGRCAIVYVIAIPLYLAGHMYGGKSFFDGLFSAVHQCVNLVVLKYSTDSVATLMKESAFYAAILLLYLGRVQRAVIYIFFGGNAHMEKGERRICQAQQP